MTKLECWLLREIPSHPVRAGRSRFGNGRGHKISHLSSRCLAPKPISLSRVEQTTTVQQPYKNPQQPVDTNKPTRAIH